MKRVSLDVAKAIKEADYRQRLDNDVILTESYNDEMYEFDPGDTISFRMHINSTFIESYDNIPKSILLECPTYLEVWLWLWREKGFRFELAHPEYKGEYDFDKLYCNVTNGIVVTDDYSDPEEAIIKVIDCLVDNDLIK